MPRLLEFGNWSGFHTPTASATQPARGYSTGEGDLDELGDEVGVTEA